MRAGDALTVAVARTLKVHVQSLACATASVRSRSAPQRKRFMERWARSTEPADADAHPGDGVAADGARAFVHADRAGKRVEDEVHVTRDHAVRRIGHVD